MKDVKQTSGIDASLTQKIFLLVKLLRQL